MKTAVAVLALAAGATAFAPASLSARTSTQVKAAELDNYIGVGPETANKIVRTLTALLATVTFSYPHTVLCFCFIV